MRILVWVCALAAAGCGGSGDHGGGGAGGGGGSGGSGPTSGPRIHTRIVTPGANSSKGSRIHPESVGQSATAGLTDLSYYIVAISVCESLENNGSGYSNPQGCLSLYNNPAPTQFQYMPNMDYSGLATAARTDTDPSHFVNLIDPVARQALESNTALTDADAHDYNFGSVGWVPVVKLQAELPIAGGTFYSHDGPSGLTQNMGYLTTASTALDTGPAEQATILHSNGGSSFKFQRPLHVDPALLSGNAELALDLVFNPEGLIKGFSAGSAGPAQLTDAAGNRMAVPFLTLTPIPHAVDDTVEREAYVLHATIGGQGFDVRVDFYTLSSDPNHAIYGVETQTLYTADTTQWVSDFPKIQSLEDDSGAGEVQLEINPPQGMTGKGPAVLRHFLRRPAGGAGTVELHCTDPAQGGFSIPGCAVGDTLTVPVEYLGTSTLPQ